jgi:K+/H+ antiporter YhaU regulatory subunit KhtT
MPLIAIKKNGAMILEPGFKTVFLEPDTQK